MHQSVHENHRERNSSTNMHATTQVVKGRHCFCLMKTTRLQQDVTGAAAPALLLDMRQTLQLSAACWRPCPNYGRLCGLLIPES